MTVESYQVDGVKQSVFERKGVSVERLRTLIAMEDGQGVMAAAEGDPVRQSQFSRQLRELEAGLELDLVDRTVTPHVLTKEGLRLASSARQFLEGMEKTFEELHNERPVLRIGAGESVIQWLLIPLLGRVLEMGEQPIQFVNMRSRSAVEGVKSGKVDIAISRTRDGEFKSLAHQMVGSFAPVLVCRRTLFRGKRQVSWRELENLRLAVLGGGGSLRRSVNALLLEGGPKLVAEGTSHAQILELVRNGKRMVGIVPGLISNPALERLGLKAVRLSELAGEVGELAIFWKRDREQEPGISELLRALKGR